jgi:tRNA(Arg) A34 adenosine deaminase TadA
MFSQPYNVTFELPRWIENFSQRYIKTTDIRERMKFVIKAAGKNVQEKTGGPFAAAIFESDSGRLISLGVNLVITQGLSILHAEIVAIIIAQIKLKTYDIGGISMVNHELVSSTEPCAMCLGAITWSGVRRVVTAAFDQDARRIGFDEGPKPENWINSLTDRGIEVINNIERDSARLVLQLYLDNNGYIYNSRAG